MPGIERIRIVIADDHALVRSGLRQLLDEQPDLRVVGEAGSGREALELLRTLAVDVLVMDIAMPDRNGIDALAALHARAVAVPVLILTGLPEVHYALAMLRQGAAGFLGKDCDPDDIVTAIRTLARGRRYISASVAERLAEGLGRGAEGPPHERLSERELQVFVRLARGETVGQLALSLALSVKTISTYRTRVLEKLGLATNSDLTYYALNCGLIH